MVETTCASCSHGDQSRGLSWMALPPGDTGPSLETSQVVTSRRCHWHLVGGGREAAKSTEGTPPKSQPSQMSVVLKSRNPRPVYIENIIN